MARRPPSSPRAGRSILEAVFSKTGLSRNAREWRALYTWHRLAGPRLGRHVHAERVHGTTLFVRVATAPWANEMSYLRAELLERLRADPGGSFITELRFTIGPLDGLPRWDEEDPSLRPPPPPPLPAPAVDTGRVAQALLAVRDPELRAALGELFARAQAAAPPAPSSGA